MGMLRTLFVGMVLFGGIAQAASLELHLVSSCGGSDKPYLLVGTTHEVCLAPDVVIDDGGVVKAQRYPVINKVIVEITPAATDKLYAATENNIGKELAVLFRGKLIFKAPITDSLKLDKFQLLLNNAPEEVDALVDAFPGPKT